MAARRNVKWPWVPNDEAAVTDTLGAILLVGLTVLTAGAFGALLFAFDGPENTLHAEVAVRVDPGTDVDSNGDPWGDGDELVQVLHLGGEPIPLDELLVDFTVGATTYAYTGEDDSGLADALAIGDVWQSPDALNLAQATAVDVVVRAQDATSLLLAGGTVTGAGFVPGTGEPPVDPCTPDVTAPSLAIGRSDNDLTIADVAPLTVTATFTEACTSIAVAPVLHWCETSTWTHTAVTMSGGPTSYTAIITRTWALLGGHTLSFYIDTYEDQDGNTGSSTVQTDVIAGLTTYTYTDVDANSPAAAVGTLTGSTNADATCDLEATASLAEGLVATATVYGDAATGTMSNPTRALTDNNQFATTSTNGQYVEISGFDVPASATAIRAVTVGFSGFDNSNSGANPSVNLDYRVGLSGTNEPTTVVTAFTTTETDYTVTATNERDWTVADVNNLYVRVTDTTANGRTLSVNVIYVTVTYAVSTGTLRAASATFDWTAVPAGVTQTAQVRYTATGDTPTFQWWDATAGSYTTRTGTTAACGSFSCYSYTLTSNEYNAGAPRMRVLDALPTASTAGTFNIEYARMATT